MTIATAINSHMPAVAKAATSYKQDVVAVNALINSVLSSTLPTLNQVPPDYQDYVNAHVAAQGAALTWVNDVMARLLNVPENVQSYNTLLVSLLNDAEQQATTLVGNPNDKTALEILENDLNGLVGQLTIVTTFITGALNGIRNFQNNLPQMAADLQTIANKSIADSHADEAKITELNQKIDQLNADISSLAGAIAALGIAAGAAIALGVIATIAAFPIGAVMWLFAGPAVAAAATFIALDSIQIQNDKNAIEDT